MTWFPIIIILLCVGGLFFLSSSGRKKQGTAKNSGQMVSAQDFINVRDIVDHVLYTRDNYCIAYVRLQPPIAFLKNIWKKWKGTIQSGFEKIRVILRL